jgi:hypothetical protein
MASKLVMEMSGDDLHDRWGTHIAKIADAWVWVMQGRVRFRSTFRMLQRSAASEKARRDTQSWLYYLWGTDAMMAVRRELDDQAGVINIKHLLHEIEARPDVMTRRRFMEWACPSCCWCHCPDEKKTATRHFESFDLIRFPQENEWDEFERDYVDPASVAGDRRKMEADANEAFRYAQLLIAHRTPKDHLEIHGTAIDRALDSIWETVRMYYLLLSSEPLTKRPRPPRHWRETFRHAWCAEAPDQKTA